MRKQSSHPSVPSYRIGSWDVKSGYHWSEYFSRAKVHRNEVHAISENSVWPKALMSIGIHRAEHECIGHLLIFFRRCDAKFVPMSPEVNISLHHVRKRHDGHITLIILHNASYANMPYEITTV
jgi:hypothetical protein